MPGVTVVLSIAWFLLSMTSSAGSRGITSAGTIVATRSTRYLCFTWEEDLGDIWVIDVASNQ
jgi:hypothetical protein